MKAKITRLCFASLAALLVTACGPDAGSVNDDASPGSADFSVFVSVGDSLTAGYADSALYRDGQLNSFPALLAQQFALAGGGAFTQPLMPVGATGKLSLTGSTEIGNLTNDRLVLGATGDPESPVAPETIAPTQSTAIDTRVGNGGFNNMGVPGAKLYHVPFPGYGNLNAAIIDAAGANPFFARFSSSDATSMLADANAQAPTFILFWMGNNDVLLYAADGGLGVDQTGNPNVATYGPEDDITDPGFFANGFPGLALPGYADMVAALTAGGARGVLINVPDIRTIPYFTTVPHNPVELTAAEANELNTNAAIIGYNAAIAGLPGGISQTEAEQRTLVWQEGMNPLLITDDNLTDLTGGGLPSMRLATENDLVLLPTSSKIGTDNGFGFLWGVSVALEDGDVLSEAEVELVNNARIAYNEIIEATADADPNLVLYDADARLMELNENGLLYGSGGVTSQFVQGGFYSLDGIHPTARGHAVIANDIMQVIEDAFGATLPPLNPGDFPTVFYQ